MSFYDDDYWQHSEGRYLWQLRKLQAFIIAIVNPETPHPFFTTINEGISNIHDEGGWIASWGTVGDSDTGTLTVEYEGDSFMVYASLPSKEEYEYEFWYQFGFDSGVGKMYPWDDFDTAVESAQNWLLTNADALKRDRLASLHDLFNINMKEES